MPRNSLQAQHIDQCKSNMRLSLVTCQSWFMWWDWALCNLTEIVGMRVTLLTKRVCHILSSSSKPNFCIYFISSLAAYAGDWNKIVDHVLIFKSHWLDRSGQSIWSVYFLKEGKNPSNLVLYRPWKVEYSKGLQVGLSDSCLFLL